MAKATVLVIEDNLDNFELVRFLLEQADFEIHGAADGRYGMQRAQELRPDIILLDMSLPEIDGWTLARQFKTNEITRTIPVIALTAHALPSDRKKAFEAGCDGYITKPLDVPNFVKLVTSYLPKK